MKTKVLDTNVILDHSLQGILDQLVQEEEGQIEIVIPFKVSRELNTFKKGNELKHYNARRSIALMESLRKSGNLVQGVPYMDKFIVKVVLMDEDYELDRNIVDNAVVLTAQTLQYANEETEILTEDVDERILADVFGVESRGLQAPKDVELYTGKEVITITEKQLQEFYEDEANPSFKTKRKLSPNQFVEMHDEAGGIHYGIYNAANKSIDGLKKGYQAWSVRPKKDKNGEVIQDQAMFMHLLLDPKVQFISAIGPSGCGKTLLALAAGLEQVLNTRTYNKMIVMRPLVDLDKDIGALPGDKLDKLGPWMASSFDNLEYLMDAQTPKGFDVEMLSDKEKIFALIDLGKLEFEAMAYIRGRSIHKQFIIVDDAQNLTPHQAASIITRASEGSKVIFLGDINQKQIDNPRLNPFNNGLTYVAERFKGADPIVGHISFSKENVVRSRLAALGVELL